MIAISSPCSVCGGLLGWPCKDCPVRTDAELAVCDRPECRAEHARVAHLRAIVNCDDLDEFFDGELPTDRAIAFRDHLVACDHCQEIIHGRMQEQSVLAR